jgi:ADP-ribose pyrophosphatase
VPIVYRLSLVRWRKLGEELVHDRFRRIVSRRFVLPDGQTAEFEIWDERDTVAVLALTPEQNVVLVRQFRPGPEEVLLELPGGVVEADQTPLEAARAELLEEAGYEGRLRPVGTTFANAYSTRTKHLFAATDCRNVAAPSPNEFTEPVVMTLADFREHLRGGRLTDVDAAYRALDHLGLL